MKKPQINKGVEGFTLIEMLIAIAIIGILAAVGIPTYNEYKIRGYDAHSKQALHDMYKLCNAYWLDTNPLEACDLSTIKSAYYGFTQNPDVVATLPPSPQDKFCGSAKHKDSSSTYSIDSAAVISPGNACVVEIPVNKSPLSTPIRDDPPETTSDEDLIEAMIEEDPPDEGCGGYPCGGCTPSVSKVRNRFTQQSNKYSSPENYVVYGDPSGFDWNGDISSISSGSNSRTEISQGGCIYFADELGITDYDVGSRSWRNCKYRYDQIVDGTLEGETRRWGASAHAGTMHAEGMGTPYAKSSMSHGSCGDGPESFKVDNGKPPCSQVWQKGCPQKVGDTWKVNF